MTQVDIQNLTFSKINERFVKDTVCETLQYIGIKGIIRVGVAFVGRARIRDLNKKYNKKDRATDVLSFASGRQFVVPKEAGEYLGEIIICPVVVKEKAAKLHIPVLREFSHIIIHGTLHLAGFDHGDDVKKIEEMHTKEEEIMNYGQRNNHRHRYRQS